MNTDVLVAVCNSEQLTKSQKLLLLVLGVRCNANTGQLNPSVSTLTRDTGMSRREVFRARQRLRELGILQVSNTGARGNSHMRIDLDRLLTGASVAPVDEQGEPATGARVSPGSATQAPTSARVAPELVPGWHPKWKVEVDSEVHIEVDRETSGGENDPKNNGHVIGETLRGFGNGAESHPRSTSADWRSVLDEKLSASPELSKSLYFDSKGSPRLERLYPALCGWRNETPHQPSSKQRKAVIRMARYWWSANVGEGATGAVGR